MSGKPTKFAIILGNRTQITTANLSEPTARSARSTMSKFNPGLMPQIVAHPITKLTTRQLDRAIRKFAKYFNVDNDLDHVVSIAEWWGYTMGNSHKYVFVFDEQSEYGKMAFETPEMWDLAISSETDDQAVLIIK